MSEQGRGKDRNIIGEQRQLGAFTRANVLINTCGNVHHCLNHPIREVASVALSRRWTATCHSAVSATTSRR